MSSFENNSVANDCFNLALWSYKVSLGFRDKGVNRAKLLVAFPFLGQRRKGCLLPMLGMLLHTRASLWHKQQPACVSFPFFRLQWGKTSPNGPNHWKRCAGGGFLWSDLQRMGLEQNARPDKDISRPQSCIPAASFGDAKGMAESMQHPDPGLSCPCA